MEYFYTVLVSVVALAVLFMLTKLMGEKQVSQMSLFDYIIGISIGSIAAEMATKLETPLKPLIAMVVFGVIAFLCSIASNKSIAARKFINGMPIILYDNGELYRDNFKKARLDLGEFLALCRVSGYFDLTDIETAYLERNGIVSFLPKSSSQPPAAEDMKLPVKQKHTVFCLVSDGKLQKDNLKYCGKNEKWLLAQLKNQGFSELSEVFLATIDFDGNLSAYSIKPKSKPVDMLE